MWGENANLISNFNGALVILSSTLLGMWLLIHAMIKVNPCPEKGPLL